VRVFERQWLVNLILWGNFTKLRDAALAEVGDTIEGNVLQVACVYGDFTQQLVRRLQPSGRLDVVDVAPIQLENLQKKINQIGTPTLPAHVRILLQDSSALELEDASFDSVVVFFLLHEQPADVRLKTIAEALRVTKKGGKLIFVDYHKPKSTSIFRYLMNPILRTLEPFALDLWKTEICDWLPADITISTINKQTYFGGLYQKVVVVR
jgi:ubiquinone/menaquinone biosynthesis C-methylase UbiE